MKIYSLRRIILWLAVILFLISLAGLVERFAFGYGPEFHLKPKFAHPGDLVLLELKGAGKDAEVSGSFDGKVVKMFRRGNRYIGFAAVPLAQREGAVGAAVNINPPAGKYAAGGNNGPQIIEIKYEIKPKKWPVVKVPEYPPLSPEKFAKYAAEKSAIKTALVTYTDKPLWDKPFISPLPELFETSPFGENRVSPVKTRWHRGTDFRAAEGQEIRAMASGRVILIGDYVFEGKNVILDHGLGLQTLYMHLSKISVKEGQMVGRGEVIGYAGKTGDSTGPHLHLETRVDGEAVEPLQILELSK